MTTETEPLAGVLDAESLRKVMVEHTWRGLRVQAMLRIMLAVFVVAVVVVAPPIEFLPATATVAGVYAVWCVALHAILLHWPSQVDRLALPAPFVDMAALTVLAILASRSNSVSWTSDILLSGFALIPLLTATQLRPTVSMVVAVPNVLVFFAAAAAARPANGEPWSSIVLRTMVIAALSLGGVWLSRVQRSRVDTIAALAHDKALLLDDVLRIEVRERGLLAEALHDGALQYVLAARQELGTLRADMAISSVAVEESFDRVDDALQQTTELLRDTLTGLHPAVLEQHGLGPALGDLAKPLSANGIQVLVDTAGWPGGTTAVDQLLFATARELLQNVVKHAHAGHVEVTAECDGGDARLVIVDDGVGISAAAADSDHQNARLRAGHLGLMSRRVRLEAQGGSLAIGAGRHGGTVAIAVVPVKAPTAGGAQ